MKITEVDKKLTLSEKIEKIVDRDGCTYIEAIARYAEDNNLTHNKIARMLCKRLRQEVESEAKLGKLVRPETIAKLESSRKQTKKGIKHGGKSKKI